MIHKAMELFGRTRAGKQAGTRGDWFIVAVVSTQDQGPSGPTAAQLPASSVVLDSSSRRLLPFNSGLHDVDRGCPRDAFPHPDYCVKQMLLHSDVVLYSIEFTRIQSAPAR